MNIESLKILVVGDIMLDKYVEGEVNRISPESPVPIVEIKNEYSSLGGCGNVVRNLRELGAQVDCLSSVGYDRYGEIIKQKLIEIGAKPIILNGSETTTVKERIIASERKVQMLRIDRESIKDVESSKVIKIFEDNSSNEYNMIVISDYAKGMITSNLMSYFKNYKNINIIVDPKPQHVHMYNGVYMVTPNEKEWNQMMVSSPYTLNHVSYILETKGSKGMKLIDCIQDTRIDIPSEEVQVSNVSGCGDVVIAVLAVCLSSTLIPLISAQIANQCAGYTASLPGTSVIPKNKFMKYLDNFIGG